MDDEPHYLDDPDAVYGLLDTLARILHGSPGLGWAWNYTHEYETRRSNENAAPTQNGET
jgi:hypothetical protein